MTLEPHPYALLLPPLTDDEYDALKADIAEHGILYPVIVDEDDRVLDGVHRVRIAAELGIEPPVNRHTGLDDERKLHLAVGLNMRRRHLDADRRRALVRKLSTEQGLSVRKISSITGWSKSTVDRDLKESPFEAALGGFGEVAEGLREMAAAAPSDDVRRIVSTIGDGFGHLETFVRWAEGQWKQGAWPPSDLEEHFLVSCEAYTLSRLLARAVMPDAERPPPPVDWRSWWDRTDREEHLRAAESFREKGLLLGVPDGTADRQAGAS
jgi:hypothetical protein